MADIHETTAIMDVQAGNADSYRIVVERYHRGLIQHLYNLTRDVALAEDIAQDAFVRAYEKIAQYNPEYAFSTWLYKIADNLAYNHLRRARPTMALEEHEERIADDRPSLEEFTDREITKRSVQAALETLPLAYRQVIALYYWDNFSYEEIAAIMDRPVGTVRTWLHRAKQQLRKELYGQL
ncbi:MAG TPA: sigma-70 family RNA polymerase sigma factor [Candidatus Saccharimonadales bacterium]|nr:sigma-70 family RNA polymerase sigma factor [Candidatus Saccharimonadales bacterium]